MAFNDYELSAEDGQPVRLYEFLMGETTWRYTSAESDITLASGVYKAMAIVDNGSKQTGDAVSDTLTVEAPNNCGPVRIFMTSPPTEPITIRIMSMHQGMTTPIVSYVGEVIQCNYVSAAMSRLSCQTLSASMRRDGVRLSWQRTCPFAHYDPLTCKVDKNLHMVAGTVTAINGFVLTVPEMDAQLDGKFSAGMLEWTHPLRGSQLVMVENHTGSAITVFGEVGDIYEGAVVRLYPGCDRTTSACRSFNNLNNFGGAPRMPGKSPFENEVLFY